MSKTTELIAALRCSSSVPSAQLDCRTCAFHMEETVDGKDYAGCECDRILVDAADKIEELVDRCARYAEEIAVLQERVEALRGGGSGGNVMERLTAHSKQTSHEKCGGIDRLRELAEADKAGRLVVLPCKVGDTVWITGSVRRLYSEKVRTFFCGDPSYSRWMADNGVKMMRTTGCDIPIHEFGKTVFLTREEAEKALEAMKKETEHA